MKRGELDTELTTCSGAIEHWHRHQRVGDLGLTTADQKILAEIGIPANFEPLFVGHETLDALLYQGKSFVSFASEYGADLVIEPNSRQLLSIVHSGRGFRFVNSDLARFLVFVCRLKPVWVEWRHKRDVLIDAEVLDLRQRLEPVDPNAFRTSACWWSLVFEQFEAGLL